MNDINRIAKQSDNRVKKEKLIAEMTARVQKSKAMVFTNYQGLTHLQLEGIKKAVKKLDADFVATKNTLLLLALDGITLSDEDKKYFSKPTATLFMYGDIVEPLKVVAKTMKDLKLPELKFGIVEGKSITGAQVLKLSTLPPLPVLRAQLLGQMISPIQSLHRALSWNIQQFVMTLSAIAAKKA